MDYHRRIIDDELDVLLGALPAVAIEGPRAVGKTQTALQRAATVHRLDDPGQRAIAEADPRRLTTGASPILVDEWQQLVSSWDVVRRAVDDDPAPGRFLLTGSATPAQQPTHTGAGRITPLRLRPLSLAERGLSRPTVSLGDLLRGGRPPVSGTSSSTIEDYVTEIVASGFPAIRPLRGRALRAQLDGYLDRAVQRDVEEAGRAVRNEPALRRWLAAYAAATATTASYETVRDAATSGSGDKPARSTTIPYQDALERLWLVDQVPAWLPTRNHLKRLVATPKHHLADPALAARLLGAGPDALLEGRPSGPSMPRDGTLLGALFESLVTLSVRVYAQASEARVRHLRTQRGEREVDLIVERDDQRVVAMEVKLSRTVDAGDLRHLLWLRDRLGTDLLDAVVVTTGEEAYRRADGIAVIPADLLGP